MNPPHTSAREAAEAWCKQRFDGLHAEEDIETFLAGFAARGKLDAEIASNYTSCDFDDSAQLAAGQILCAIHDLDSAQEDT